MMAQRQKRHIEVLQFLNYYMNLSMIRKVYKFEHLVTRDTYLRKCMMYTNEAPIVI